jgi:hypothetical protein
LAADPWGTDARDKTEIPVMARRAALRFSGMRMPVCTPDMDQSLPCLSVDAEAAIALTP